MNESPCKFCAQGNALILAAALALAVFLSRGKS